MSAVATERIFWDWIRLIKRIELGFNPSPTGDPKKRIASNTVQHVALAAATYASPDGTSIRPGLDRLARVCRLDPVLVGKCLARLRDLGLLLQTFAGSKAGRGGGKADEHRMAIPEDLAEKVAMLDPDEGELVVPEGVEPPPLKKPRAKKRAATDGGSHGAAPAVEPVDNSGSPGAAPGDPAPIEKDHPVLHRGSPGAAPVITRCSTAPPTQDLLKDLPHTLNSPYGAEVEGDSAGRREPSASHGSGGKHRRPGLVDVDLEVAYAAAFGALNRLPDFGQTWVIQAQDELGPSAATRAVMIRAHQLSQQRRPA